MDAYIESGQPAALGALGLSEAEEKELLILTLDGDRAGQRKALLRMEGQMVARGELPPVRAKLLKTRELLLAELAALVEAYGHKGLGVYAADAAPVELFPPGWWSGMGNSKGAVTLSRHWAGIALNEGYAEGIDLSALLVGDWIKEVALAEGPSLVRRKATVRVVLAMSSIRRTT